MKRTILITGGAGFIGSHVVKRFVRKYSNYLIVNADNLTYAGNLENLTDIEKENNYKFEKTDIIEKQTVLGLFEKYDFDAVIHLAAESHVDRSITDPDAFVFTNIIGTVNLLNASLNKWKNNFERKLFYHISTDEVYGSLGKEGQFTEKTSYDPKSPYSASKASSDHLVRAYNHTFGLPAIISNCSNNYGPNQFPEKLIPLAINNIKNNKPIPVYGKGENIRDWLYVEDHCRGILAALEKGRDGEIYNIGGNRSLPNMEVVRRVLAATGKPESLIQFVTDRPGHDRRYALSSEKLMGDAGWRPLMDFETGLAHTIDWYRANAPWVARVRSGAYREYYERNYGQRSVQG